MAVGVRQPQQVSTSPSSSALLSLGHSNSRQGVERVEDAVIAHGSAAAEESLVKPCLTPRSILTTPTLGFPSPLVGLNTSRTEEQPTLP